MRAVTIALLALLLGGLIGFEVGVVMAPDLVPTVIRHVMQCKVGGFPPLGLPPGRAPHPGHAPDPLGELLRGFPR